MAGNIGRGFFAMGSRNQPRDWRGRWTTTGAGRRLGSQRKDFEQALQSQGTADNDGRSTVYAYLRDKDTPSGKAGSPYYIGVAGDKNRPYAKHGRTPVPSDERRIRMLRSNVTHNQARMWEEFYIAKFGRKDIHSGRQLLLNRTDGGDGMAGHKRSASSRAKQSATTKGTYHGSAEKRAQTRMANQAAKWGMNPAEYSAMSKDERAARKAVLKRQAESNQDRQQRLENRRANRRGANPELDARLKTMQQRQQLADKTGATSDQIYKMQMKFERDSLGMTKRGHEEWRKAGKPKDMTPYLKKKR